MKILNKYILVQVFLLILFMPSFAFTQITWWIPETQNNETFLKNEMSQQINKVDAHSSLLNYNPVLSFNSEIEIDLSKTKLSQCEIFTVFIPSNSSEEELIWKLKGLDDQLLFTDKRIADLAKRKFMNFIDRDLSQPQIVNYHHDQNDYLIDKLVLNGKPKNNLIPVTDFKGYLSELIVFNSRLSPISRQIIESHLALKYSIAMTDNFNYLNSKGQVIWDLEKNKYYSNRVSGLGRNDALHFYQKQSSSRFGKGNIILSIGEIRQSNFKNTNFIDDDSYLIWADNDAPLIFEEQYNKVSLLKRKWKLSAVDFNSSDKFSFALSHDEILDDLRSDQFLWLAFSNTEISIDSLIPGFYQLEIESHFAQSSDIRSNSENTIFEIYKAPKLWAYLNNTIIPCDEELGELLIVPVGGEKPYEINVSSLSNDSYESYVLDDSSNNLKLNIKPDQYKIRLTDANGATWETKYFMNNDFAKDLDLPNSLTLHDDESIVLGADIDNGSNVFYTWKNPKNEMTEDSEIVIEGPGLYELQLTSENCSYWHSLWVDKVENNIKSLSVFPNPSASGYFQLSAALEKPSKYAIKITDNLGRVVSYKEYDEAQYIIHNEVLQYSGTFTISIISSTEVKSKKLIILRE